MITTSRFQGISRWQAALILFITGALIIIGATSRFMTDEVPAIKTEVSTKGAAKVDRDPDLTLYRTIITRVAAGQPYYTVVAEEHRRQNYPLRPFITVRLPTLASVTAVVGMTSMKVMIWLLMAVTLLAWWRKLDGAFDVPGHRMLAILLLISGLSIHTRSDLVVVHDLWAGLLVCLSLALHREDRWLPAILIALLAVLIREITFPYILLMGASALWRRQKAETASWAAAACLFIAFMIVHAHAVTAVVLPTDTQSQGWTRFGGWTFFTVAVQETTSLRAVPGWFSAILIPLSILGWAGWRSLTGATGFLLIMGYAIIFAVLGRPENFYWGMAIAPMFLLGMAFLLGTLLDLFTALKGPRPAGLSS
ncbi:MAG: hypothetical protein ACKVOJ_02320 [Sphingomonadaceae bacterium]